MKNKLTLLVNSCDAYSDLWHPLFTLLNRYWKLANIPVLLNTETKDFSFPGLNIRCIHTQKDVPYGNRMINALQEVKTEFVLLFLDDFFLRSPVDTEKIEEILLWMSADKNIVCFNFEASKVYADWELDVYPGFRRVPPGNMFTLNMQAAIWRTKDLRKYWRPNVSPWEWEVFCNALTTYYPKDKFYCAKDRSDRYINYGHRDIGDYWGVVNGKWLAEDVIPLFEKEKIQIDYSGRGYFIQHDRKDWDQSRKGRYGYVWRCMGPRETLAFFLFCRVNNMRRRMGLNSHYDYFRFLCERAKAKFLRGK